FCARQGIALRDSLDEILADPEIDAVVFATPHSEHGKQVEVAAGAGKHVFMEKPFTLDRNSAARALDAVARAGIVLGVAYPRRFHPSMRELKARIDGGRLGTLAHCSAEQNGPAGLFMYPASWRSRAGAPPTGRQVAAEPEMIQNRGSNTLLAELEAFAAAIRGEAPYPITPEEILHGVAAFEAIIRSAAEHRPVRVVRD